MKPNQGQSDPSGMSSYFEQGKSHYKLSPHIKIIPTTVSICPFSGTDNDFSAREFITLCEDVIKGSSIAEDTDKISFIPSRLVHGSRALNLMQSSDFSLPDIGSDHKQLKQNFVKVFCDSERESLVKQFLHMVDNLQSNAASCPI